MNTITSCSCVWRPVWHRTRDDIVWDSVDCWAEDKDISEEQRAQITQAHADILDPYIRPVRRWYGRTVGYHLCVELASEGTLYLRLIEAAQAVVDTPEGVAS